MGFLSLSLGAGYACFVYDKSLLLSVPSDGAIAEAGPADAGVSDGDPCLHAKYPGRPAADDPGGIDAGELVFALQSIEFNVDAGAGEVVGYDLDNVCTCPGAPSCVSTKQQCDDPRGRDNAAGTLLDTFMSYAALFDPQKINLKFAEGRIGLLVRVRRYNGTQNDTDVEVAILLSNGTEGAEDGGTPKPPVYDGTDVWTVDPRSLLGGVAPPYVPNPDQVDTSAYVSGGVVVSSINAANIDFAGGAGTSSLQVDLTGVVLTGRIIPAPGGGFTVAEGVLSGRWATRKFLTSIATIHDPLNPGTYLCGDSGTYADLKPLICGARDITSLPLTDNMNAPCDALSFALAFNATPANLGAVYGGVPPVMPCGAQWQDDCP